MNDATESARRPDWHFPAWIAGILLAAAAAGGYPLAVRTSTEVCVAAAIGAVLSAINVFAGYLAVEYAFDKPYAVFLRVVFGGMVVRLFFMAGALMLLILGFGVEAVPLTVSMLSFYFVYLVLELIYLQKKISLKQQR